jgi:hypothetical protein
VHKEKLNGIIVHRKAQGPEEKVADFSAVLGRNKRSRRFQHNQAVIDRVRAAHPFAYIIAAGHHTCPRPKGIQQTDYLENARTLHDVAYKRRPANQADHRRTGDIILSYPVSNVQQTECNTHNYNAEPITNFHFIPMMSCICIGLRTKDDACFLSHHYLGW